MAAILGKKLGMTQIFTEDGDRVPVTVIEAGPCPVTQVKTSERDGYTALQIGFGAIKERKVTKPQAGHFKKAGVKPVRHLAEIRVDLEEAVSWVTAGEQPEKKKSKGKAKARKEEARETAVEAEEAQAAAEGEAPAAEAAEGAEAAEAEAAAEAEPVEEAPEPPAERGGLKAGDMITVEAFAEGQQVKVSGISKGKGFAGVIKRHNFSGGPGSHGSHFGRAPGSVGASAYPSRVFKGLRLPGQMGNKKRTQRGLTVFRTDADNNLLFLKGSVPGSKNGIIFIQTD